MNTPEHTQRPTWTVAPGGLGRALHYGAAPSLYVRHVRGYREQPVRWEPHAVPEHST
jgi:hypothetical protein